MSAATVRSAWRSMVVLAAALALAGCTAAVATPQTIYLTLPPPAETPTPEPTPAPTPSPTLEPTPTPSPTPSPTSAAAACTASAAQKTYLEGAAKVLAFDLYCAVMPKGWWLQEANYVQTNGGLFSAIYTNNAGDVVILQEGRLCDDLASCSDSIPVLGAASFDGLAGTLRDIGGGSRLVVVNPHSIPGYALYSHQATQAQVIQFAAAVVKVPKPTP